MPRRSQQERSRSTRAALVATARGLFAERGYAQVPAEEIVTAAGVTRGALYHHFADKQELFRSLQTAQTKGCSCPPCCRCSRSWVLSAMIEAALLIAHAADPKAARADAEQALLTLLSGTVRQPP